MRRAVVIGAGFFGTAVARHLAGLGLEVALASRSFSAGAHALVSPSVRLVACDVSDPDAVGGLITRGTHVFYCAGTSLPAEVELDPDADLARSMPPLLQVLAELGRHDDCGITFFASGGTAYGRTPSLPASEDHPTHPVSSYGINKLVAEQYVDLLGRRHGFATRILRCGNAYGPEQPTDRGQGVVASFLHAALRGHRAVVFGDGGAIRDYVHIDDVARVAVGLAALPHRQLVVNVGTGRGTSVAELVVLVETATGRALDVAWADQRIFDVSAVVLDIGRQQHLLPDVTPRRLEDGIACTLTALGEANTLDRVLFPSPGQR